MTSVMAIGNPELKDTPAWFPKYQLLNSPWENPKKGRIRNRPIMILAFKNAGIKMSKREAVSSSRFGLVKANVMIYLNITIDNKNGGKLS